MRDDIKPHNSLLKIHGLKTQKYFLAIQATTDSAGQYAIAWTPPIQGVYTVIATFQGSDSYWSSQAETAVNVVQGPTNTPVPTQASQSMADLYFVPAIAGLLVAIIAVGAVLAILMLRKRP